MRARVYRVFGDTTVGLFGNVDFDGSSPPSYAFGIDAEYKTDTAKVTSAFVVVRDPGSGPAVISSLASDLSIGDHLKVETLTMVLGDGTDSILLQRGRLGYQIGPFTPYITGIAAVTPSVIVVGAEIGADFEQQVNDGPLTLLAGVEYTIASAGGSIVSGWSANAGFDYAVGHDDDGPLSIRGGVEVQGDFGSTVGWTGMIGIGVEFGEGHISGFSLDDLDL